MTTDPQLHPADPALQRLSRWVLLPAVVAAALAIWALDRWLASLGHAADVIEPLTIAFAGLAMALALIGLLLGWTLRQQARRIIHEDRFPSSDMRTVRSVPIRRGHAARRIARMLDLGALLSVVLAGALLVWMVWALRALG